MIDTDSIYNKVKQFVDDPDIEDMVSIGLDNIETQSDNETDDIFKNIINQYYDDDFLRDNPLLKKSLDTEIESYKVLLKMRHADEEMQKVLVHAIEQATTNASLYKSLTDMQKTIMVLTKQLDDKRKTIKEMLRAYQTEINFNASKDESNELSEEEDNNALRGTKTFIQQMQKQVERQIKDAI